MDVPAAVRQELGDEQIVAGVPFPDDSGLYLTSDRLLVHRASGLLSDESVAVHSLDAERLSVDAGRRKATVVLGYVDGEAEFTAPADRLDPVVGTLLPAVLRANGIADEAETAVETYRFGELTLVVTDARLLKHVGDAVWGPDCAVVAYESVIGLDVEKGSVSSQLVVRAADRDYRVKVPSEQVRAVHRTVEEALLEFHGFESYAEFERHASEAADGGPGPSSVTQVYGGDETDDTDEDAVAPGVDPIAGTATADDDGDSDDPGIGVRAVDREPDDDEVDADEVDRERLARRVERLADALDRQRALLEEQQATVEELLDALDE